MLRHDAGENADFFDFFAQFFIRHIVQHITGDDVIVVFHADLFCNRRGCTPVISGNHNDTDARFIAYGNIGFDAFSWRIGKTDKPEESQGAIGNFFGNIVICLRIHSGNRNHAKTP